MHKVNDRYFQFPGAEFIQLPERVRRLAFPRTRTGEFFRIDCFLKNYVGTDEWQCRISAVETLMYVVLSKA